MADLKTKRATAEAVRQAKRDRVCKAAVAYVYDKGCRATRQELDAAVVDLIGTPLANTPPIVRGRR